MLNYIFIFFIYSFIGWIIEVLHVGLVTEKKFYNRGFFNLPIIPIYGFGALSIIILFEYISFNKIVSFIIIVVFTSILEYVTSLIMENLFHIKWWDYSNFKYQLNGRICLKNSILFGLGGLIILKVNPLILSLVINIDQKLIKSFDFILLLLIFIDLYRVLVKLTGLEIRDIKFFSTRLKFKHVKNSHLLSKNRKFRHNPVSRKVLKFNFNLNIGIFIVIYLMTNFIVISAIIAIISFISMYITINIYSFFKHE